MLSIKIFTASRFVNGLDFGEDLFMHKFFRYLLNIEIWDKSAVSGGIQVFFSNHHLCCSEYGLSQSKGILLHFFFFFFPESILIGFHCRKLHWFFLLKSCSPTSRE